MTDTRPDAAMLSGIPLYTYMTIPGKMKKLIPSRIWRHKVPNVGAKERAMSPEKHSNTELFKAEAVDLESLLSDLGLLGYRPVHVHLMVRENGNIRIRYTWLQKPLTELDSEERSWVYMMFHRFLWNAMAHRSWDGTAHLPPHIALNCAYPTERSQATSVQSVQVFHEELALITDSDSALSARSEKAGK